MKKLLCVLLSCVCVLTVNALYREVRMPERPKTPTYNDYNTKDEGFWCAVELDGGSSVMLDSPNVPYTSLTFTGGYRFSEYLRVGAGLGCRMNINNADYFKKRAISSTCLSMPISAATSFRHTTGMEFLSGRLISAVLQARDSMPILRWDTASAVCETTS